MALSRQLQPAAWIDLFLMELADLPVFEYMVREGDFMPFDKASRYHLRPVFTGFFFFR